MNRSCTVILGILLILIISMLVVAVIVCITRNYYRSSQAQIVYASVGSRIATNGALMPLVFDSIEEGRHHGYDPLTGIFTVPHRGDGNYFIAYRVTAGGTGATLKTGIWHNDWQHQVNESQTDDGSISSSYFTRINLIKGDRIRISAELTPQGGNYSIEPKTTHLLIVKIK